MFGNPPRTISNWVKKVDETGDLNSLCTKPRSGRLPELNVQQTQETRQALCEPPEKNGVMTNIWNGKSPSWYIKNKYVLNEYPCLYLKAPSNYLITIIWMYGSAQEINFCISEIYNQF